MFLVVVAASSSSTASAKLAIVAVVAATAFQVAVAQQREREQVVDRGASEATRAEEGEDEQVVIGSLTASRTLVSVARDEQQGKDESEVGHFLKEKKFVFVFLGLFVCLFLSFFVRFGFCFFALFWVGKKQVSCVISCFRLNSWRKKVRESLGCEIKN